MSSTIWQRGCNFRLESLIQPTSLCSSSTETATVNNTQVQLQVGISDSIKLLYSPPLCAVLVQKLQQSTTHKCNFRLESLIQPTSLCSSSTETTTINWTTNKYNFRFESLIVLYSPPPCATLVVVQRLQCQSTTHNCCTTSGWNLWYCPPLYAVPVQRLQAQQSTTHIYIF